MHKNITAQMAHNDRYRLQGVFCQTEDIELSVLKTKRYGPISLLKRQLSSHLAHYLEPANTGISRLLWSKISFSLA